MYECVRVRASVGARECLSIYLSSVDVYESVQVCVRPRVSGDLRHTVGSISSTVCSCRSLHCHGCASSSQGPPLCSASPPPPDDGLLLLLTSPWNPKLPASTFNTLSKSITTASSLHFFLSYSLLYYFLYSIPSFHNTIKVIQQ